ncbi:phage tail protein [Escherichia coli]|nr:phage tail protein [Escherichia coli]EGP3296852.1 phage tail protein [Escherichia coli]EKP3529774.1 phage tail assembly chaperone family protein, TAC [Escherichia coli]
MQLTRETLQHPGVFAGRPVQKTITWKQGDQTLTATTWIRQRSYQDIVLEQEAGKADTIAIRIARSVCDEQGEAVFTVEDITGEACPDRGPLDAGLAVALLKAISDVYLGKTD